MTVPEEIERGKLCRIASPVLGGIQVFSAITGTLTAFAGTNVGIAYPDVISATLLLSPIFLLVLVRRFCPLVALMAFLIVPIFLGRMYFGLRFLASGYFEPKGDWAIWLNSFVGATSLGMIALWAFGRAILFVADRAFRLTENKGGQ